jgi:uncharacterized membrane protein YjjP (DUF1212 family)
LREILTLALWAGSIVMENGGNTIRVEETVHRLGTAMGAEWLEVFATPSGIIATDLYAGEHRTKVWRIVTANVDLSRLAAVSDLVRSAAPVGIDCRVVRQRLEQIAAQPRVYSERATTSAVALACASFAILFGGGAREFLATLVAAVLSQLTRTWLTRRRLSRPMTTGIAAAVGSMLAFELAQGIGAPRPDLAMLSAVLLLVPGVFLVSSITDLITGHVLSAVAKAANVVLLTASIGIGLWFALLVTGSHLR